MRLYWKIIRFIFPFWKLVIVSVFLTLFFIFFDSLSLWVSVDLVGELFRQEGQRPVITQQADSLEVAAQNDSKSNMLESLGLGNANKFYKKITLSIRGWLIRPDRMSTLKNICFIIILTFFLKNIFSYCRRLLSNYIGQRMLINIRNFLGESIIRLPLSFFERHHSGEFVSIVFNDVNAMNMILEDSF